MWQKPWGYKEGFAICGGLFLTGTFLQITIGKCELSILSYPMNVCVGVLYLVILLLIYAFSQKSYFIRWMGSCQAAVSSMVSVAMLTVVMGLIRQVKSDVPLLGAESWHGVFADVVGMFVCAVVPLDDHFVGTDHNSGGYTISAGVIFLLY